MTDGNVKPLFGARRGSEKDAAQTVSVGMQAQSEFESFLLNAPLLDAHRGDTTHAVFNVTSQSQGQSSLSTAHRDHPANV